MAAAILGLGLVIFGDFIFGSKLLLYKDIGSDSINANYPYFVHLSDYLREHGLPSWSFAAGMGQSIFGFTSWLLIHPIVWLPADAIAGALPHEHLLKALVVGILFQAFLRLRSLSFPAALCGAVMLSLSAYLCMGACWAGNTDEALCFTLLLFSAELAVTQGSWLVLALAVALLAAVNIFYLYPAAILLSAYVPARLFELHGWKPLPIGRTCLILALVSVLGIGLSAVVFLDSAATVFNSPRGSGTTSHASRLFSWPVFGLESPLHYASSITRHFSNDLLGVGSEFRGWQNYLEAPATYCGLIALLLLPQAFAGATARQRVLCALLLIALTIPVVFPWFRYLFWAFQGDYYRAFSLFTVLAVLTLAMTALSRYLEKGSLNLWVLFATVVFLVGLLIYGIHLAPDFQMPRLRNEVIVLLGLYTLLLAGGFVLRRQRLAVCLIAILSAIELTHFDRISVGDRPTVTKAELQQRVGYNDHSIDALDAVKAKDQGFYRITKTFGSGQAIHVSLNDALVQGYYGTTSYTSFNNLSYIQFLMAVGSIPENAHEVQTRWATGLVNLPTVSRFACERYILTLDPVYFQVEPGYRRIGTFGNVYAFENEWFVPLGVAYSSCLPGEVFLSMPVKDRHLALLQAAVLADENLELAKGLPSMDRETIAQAIASVSMEDAFAALRSRAMKVESFDQTRIVGAIEADQPSILVFQMPFDKGWRAWVDGVLTPVFKADNGLAAVPLTAGSHRVEMRYRPPYLLDGAVLSVFSLLLIVAGLRRWPRVPGEFPCTRRVSAAADTAS